MKKRPGGGYVIACHTYTHTHTFMNVSKDVDLGLDSPLDSVQELHASNTLHLLWDPVQEACRRQEVRKAAEQEEEEALPLEEDFFA